MMDEITKGLDLVFPAVNSIGRFVFVSLTSSGGVVQGARDRNGSVIGICQNSPTGPGKLARVRVSGVSRLYVFPGINPGDAVSAYETIGTGFRVIKNDRQLAIALEESWTPDDGGLSAISVLLRL